MATPTREEMLEGSTKWSKKHKGVSYQLSHHAYRTGDEYPGAEANPGTWCYYLLIPEQMFPHRWKDFACVRSEEGFESPGPAFEHDMFDSEITWSSNERRFCRHEMKFFGSVKVGCDYAHLYNIERGYPDTYESVNRDAIATVEKFLEAHPDHRLHSGWSHQWGEPDDFYTAINGALVHKDDKIPEDYDKWKPATKLHNTN